MQEKFRLWVENSLVSLMIKVLNLFRKAPCQITGKFHLYLAFLKGLVEVEGYNYNNHDVMLCLALKGSMNKFFSLKKENFMTNFYNFHNTILYYKSQAFDIVGMTMMEGIVPLVHWYPKTSTMFFSL